MTTSDETSATTHSSVKKSKKHERRNNQPSIPKPLDMPTLVSQCANKKVKVNQGEKISSATVVEALVEKMFFEAINGDAKAAKQLVRWAIKYVPKFEMPKLDGKFIYHWFKDSDAKFWKDLGCLPADAPDNIMDISVSKLNKAVKAVKKLSEKDWDAYHAKHPDPAWDAYLAEHPELLQPDDDEPE